MDVGCRNFGGISVALGIFRFWNIIFSNYLNIMYIPNSGKWQFYSRFCGIIDWISLVQFLSSIGFYGWYRFDYWWNYSCFGNCCPKMLILYCADFSGRKFICGITSKLLQIHQETLWRRPKNISNVAFTSSLSENYHESKIVTRFGLLRLCWPFYQLLL
jgi:hypothetical protein